MSDNPSIRHTGTPDDVTGRPRPDARSGGGRAATHQGPFSRGVLDVDGFAKTLAAWLPERRWFQGKARTIDDIDVAGAVELGGDVYVLVLAVGYTDGGTDHYQLPVVVDTGTGAPDTGTPDDGTAPPPLEAPLTDGGTLLLRDALHDPDAARRYGEVITYGIEYEAGDLGVLRGRPVSARVEALPGSPRVLQAEQSNTSVIFGDTFIMKAIRRLESGQHPDIELTRALTESGYRNVPAQIGSMELSEVGWPTALAVLSDFVTGAEDGWRLAVEETTAVAGGDAELRRMAESFGSLGEAIGRMHELLGSALPATPAGPAELSAWSHDMGAQLQRVLDQARERAPEAAEVLTGSERELWEVLDDVRGLPLPEVGPITRIHGDLHLGQTLLHPERGWQVLDFEGEPAKSLEDRRQPSSPLRDVAGMLRSFDYAAAAGASESGLPLNDLPADLEGWRQDARRAFLDGYEKAAPGTINPGPTTRLLLTAFELDKAVYELGYEMANRPTWVPLPVSGILRAVERYREVIS